MKIYLAGVESQDYALVLHAIGYPYRLASYLGVRDESSNVIRCALDAPEVEWIMDSGLYSFMFGAEKGKLKTFEDYEGYAKKYVADLRAWGWKHPIVECDTQRVLGVPETHRLRDEVFRPSGFEVIYVWHVPEGEAGLVELAKKEQRVALGIPELRAVYGSGSASGAGGAVHRAILRGLRLIRQAGRSDQRCHLLGNTERGLVNAPAPADTCDSTSWESGGRYGNGMYFNSRAGTSLPISVYSPKWKAWRAWCEKTFDKSFQLIHQRWGEAYAWGYLGNAACSAISYLMWMERMNGSVDFKVPERLPVAA